MDGLEFIKSLKPCTFRYDGGLDDGRTHHGFIAQDVNDVASQAKYAFREK